AARARARPGEGNRACPLGVPSPLPKNDMRPKPQSRNDADMLPEYDFSNAVRGKYYERYRQGTNVVLLDPDIAAVFPNATAVNDALRALVAVADARASRRQTETRRHTKALQPTSRARRKAKSKQRPRPTRA